MKKWSIGMLIVLIIAGIIGFMQVRRQQEFARINSYEACVNAGFPIIESYPPQCKIPNGASFTQNIGNELEFHDEILVSFPRPNSKIQTPLKINGKARGNWYFEGSFSGELFDSTHKLLGTVVLKAQGDWMTENFVPFAGELRFDLPTTKKGSLVIKNANPSGDPARDKKLLIPVNF